jgi:hypothetical protein
MSLVKAIESDIAQTEFAGASQQTCGLTLYDSKNKLNMLETMAKEGDSPVNIIRRVE